MHSFRIEELNNNNLPRFLKYLEIHLSENDHNGLFFLPMTKEQSKYNSEWEDKFREGMSCEIGQTDWRKLWLAVGQDEQILGHIDIRSRKELNTEHRVLLGMGTDRKFRQMKIGQQLLEYVLEYCINNPKILWVDLEVLAINLPAIGLYKKMGFKELSQIEDMFRINGQSYDYKSMTINVSAKGLI